MAFPKKKKVVKAEEKPVTTVVEEEINTAEIEELINNPVEEKKVSKKSDKTIGTIGDTAVTKPIGKISFEAQVAPVPMFKVPAEIRQYLINKGLTTDVYKKSKEWLEEHDVDMEMVEKLKLFLIGMNK